VISDTANKAYYFSVVVDAKGGVDVDCRVNAMIIDKAVSAASIVYIKPDDLSFVIDTFGVSIESPRKVDNGVVATAVEEAMFRTTTTLLEMPDNVPFGIDADGICVEAGWGIDGRLGTVIVEKAMCVARIMTV
jgi:hypothetical protein